MPIMAPMHHDERELLVTFLAQLRAQAKNAAYGLTDAQAASTPTASPLSVGGLIKHLTFGERGWMKDVRGKSEREVGESTDESAYFDGFRMLPRETLAGLIEEYDAAAAETDATIRATDLDQAVPVPQGGPWLPQDLDAWTVRWVALHLIQEAARHAGHADLLRESIDGGTAGTLMAAAEGWPADGWITPWSATEPTAEVAPA
jgi:hypothetical protein